MRIKSKKHTLRRLPGEPTTRSLRMIRMVANLCLVGMLTMWVVLYFWKGAPYDQVWQVLLAHLGTGRAGGVGLGLEIGFSQQYLFLQSCLTDLILILYVYPLFVSGFQHVARWPLIGPWLTKMHAAALKHKDRIAPYGAAGLMLFVVFPFWTTGPIVGVLVGYMLGMRTMVTFSAVIFGDFAAVAAWIWFYDKLKDSSNTLALTFLVLVFVFAVAGVVYARVLRWRKRATAEEEPGADAETPQDEAAPEEEEELSIEKEEKEAEEAEEAEEIRLADESPAPESNAEEDTPSPDTTDKEDDDFLELL